MLGVGAAANTAATSAHRMRLPRLLFSFMAASGGRTLGTAVTLCSVEVFQVAGHATLACDGTLPFRCQFGVGPYRCHDALVPLTCPGSSAEPPGSRDRGPRRAPKVVVQGGSTERPWRCAILPIVLSFGRAAPHARVERQPMTHHAQQIRFCTSRDGTRIAYATCGIGPPLLWIGHWVGSAISNSIGTALSGAPGC
jgi:hypothetical protein